MMTRCAFVTQKQRFAAKPEILIRRGPDAVLRTLYLVGVFLSHYHCGVGFDLGSAAVEPLIIRKKSTVRDPEGKH